MVDLSHRRRCFSNAQTGRSDHPCIENAIGTTRVSHRLYAAVNFASAATWGVLFTSIGYIFGEAFEEMTGRLRHDARLWWLVGGLLAAGVVFGLWRWHRGRRA